jgi:hypothetical protein
MKRTKASEARRCLRQSERAREAHIEDLLRADAMISGSFVTLARTCGKPTCRCVRGEKHEGKYLSRNVGGKTRLIYVPAGDEVEVATKAERYRRFRQARAALMKLAAETAKVADALQEALTEPYPKEARHRRERR